MQCIPCVACSYDRVENEKHRRAARQESISNSGSFAVKDDKADDPKFSMFARVWVWTTVTVGFVPLLRTVLGATDCTHRGDGIWSWDRDSTSDFNLLTAEEQAATPGPLYPGDNLCFEGGHTAVYVASRRAIEPSAAWGWCPHAVVWRRQIYHNAGHRAGLSVTGLAAGTAIWRRVDGGTVV